MRLELCFFVSTALILEIDTNIYGWNDMNYII